MTDSETTLDGISEQPEAGIVVIDGQELTIDELKKGYMRQSDYTKKTQELADLRKHSEAPSAPAMDEIEATKNYLKELGFATKAELEDFNRQRQNESELQDILRDIPELSTQADAIKKLASADGISPTEAAQRYGFVSKEKLERAKLSASPMGTNQKTKVEKSILDMTTAEYLKYKKEKGITTGV